MSDKEIKIKDIKISNKEVKANNKDVKALIRQVEKDFGKGVVMSFDSDAIIATEVLPTGSLLLDEALGIGGYPTGRIIEIYGPESSGKTTMALIAISQAQKLGKICAFIDVEHAISPAHAKRLGIDLEQLILSQPDSGEQALEIVDTLIHSELVDLIVVDSVAALVPKIELEGTMSDQTIGAQARLMSKMLRKISGPMSKTNTTVIFINQIREKVGVIFGSPEVTPGGRALKFYASIRLDIRLRERIREDDVQIGQRVKIKVVKNKFASPYKEIEPVILYASGIDMTLELIEIAARNNIIEKAGS
jgi:recombination protein RecA